MVGPWSFTRFREQRRPVPVWAMMGGMAVRGALLLRHAGRALPAGRRRRRLPARSLRTARRRPVRVEVSAGAGPRHHGGARQRLCQRRRLHRPARQHRGARRRHCRHRRVCCGTHRRCPPGRAAADDHRGDGGLGVRAAASWPACHARCLRCGRSCSPCWRRRCRHCWPPTTRCRRWHADTRLLGVAVVAAAIPVYRMIHVRRMAPAQELIA